MVSSYALFSFWSTKKAKTTRIGAHLVTPCIIRYNLDIKDKGRELFEARRKAR